MISYKELQEFLDTASEEERAQYLSSAPLLIQGLVQALSGDSALLIESARQDLEAYLEFINQFYHEQIAKVLLFKDHKLFIQLLQSQNHDLIRMYNSLHQPSNLEIHQGLSFVGVNWSGDYEPNSGQILIHESLRPYNYLLVLSVDKDHEEIQLLAKVLDLIPLEIFLVGDNFKTRVQSQVKVQDQKQSWLDQINLIVSALNPAPAKYLGVALALGIGLLSATEAQAGSKEAKDYLAKVNSALTQIEVPAGCQMGAKVLATNGIGMTYEVQLGDYVVKSEFHKVGNISERSELTTYKLKEQKGCGLSKSDATEMATKIDKKVRQIWSGGV